MKSIPGKLDCIRIRPVLRSPAAYILLFLTFLCIFQCSAMAQSLVSPPRYPEVAWLARSTYCNPYFGLRLSLPAEFKSELIYLPVQSHGRHMLLAMHLQRLDRSAEIFISAFEDHSENAARLAARARVQQAHRGGLVTSGPHPVSVHDHRLYRLQIASDAVGSDNESSSFFVLGGYVLHIAIFSHERDLAATLEAAVERRLEFADPGESACTPAAAFSSTNADPAPGRVYYGPALPTEFVESTVRNSPGYSVPSGQFSQGTFVDAALGVRIVLPPRWQRLPNEEAYRVTELMRDPTTDLETADRRRALFRACSRIVFTASDSATELISQVHPTLAVAAMPVGCVPDMVLPASLDDRAATEDFATVLVRSLGVPLLGRGVIQGDVQGRLTFNLDGTLPYQLPGETLSRRLSLRISATASGPWFVFVYSVTPGAAAQRDLESHVAVGTPDLSMLK